MTIKINYSNNLKDKSPINLVLFVEENFNINGLKKHISNAEFSYINDLLKNSDLNKNLLFFKINSKRTIYLISLKKNIEISDIESLGAEFHGYINYDKKNEFFVNSDSISRKYENFIGYFLHGLKLKSYEFNIYKSKKEKKTISINLIGEKNKLTIKNELRFKAIEEGTFFARDLVSEPPNVLNPKEYVNRLLKLKKLGIKVTTYNESQMKKLGMHSLLGVGRGSVNESFLVTLEWNGNKKDKKAPLSFVGKGVCFDTGGISIKPSAGMEEMKWDMGGSAVVTAVMNLLSSLNYNFTYAGIIGLVENMPSGTAYKPGDIIKSYKGTNVEVLNTDAEGRLVLADIITYGSELYKPKVIIDFATLTGSILVALGQNYAGLFSNDDNLADQIYKSGLNVDEKVWRMPMDSDFDKMMSSQFVDLKNISSGRYAGATTAAQFIQRFVPAKTKWAHLDIAGTTWKNQGDIFNRPGATGFGLLLMADFVYNYFENIKDK